MPRPQIVWSVEYDSIESFDQDAPVTQDAPQGVATVNGGTIAVPSADQLIDVRDKAQRMIAALTPDSRCKITMSMSTDGVMTVALSP